MAKILVADDNSNVQKTVALALADLGVEVVAVNNGDAAVRKLADISPDLVLADIFMPVRNGYEVCEYVKKDSRFSHVPVVLLVGAFDPLDEREAQRVGADGILKKPFVPPDPLITMVKTLLDRTLGDRLVSRSGFEARGFRARQGWRNRNRRGASSCPGNIGRIARWRNFGRPWTACPSARGNARSHLGSFWILPRRNPQRREQEWSSRLTTNKF